MTVLHFPRIRTHTSHEMDARGAAAAAVRVGCKRCRFSPGGCDRCRVAAPSASRAAGDNKHRAGGRGDEEDAASRAIGSGDTGTASGGGRGGDDVGTAASSDPTETERAGGDEDQASGLGARESGREQHGEQGEGAEADGDCGQCINCLDKPKVTDSPARVVTAPRLS